MTTELINEPVHHATLAPSSLPGLEECIHYVPDPTDDAYSERGQKLHEEVATILNGHEGEVSEDATWAASAVLQLIPQIQGIEERVYVYDPLDGRCITYGRLDVWGYAQEGGLAIADIKSGLKRDYSAQMSCYALAKMDELSADLCKGFAVYVDARETGEYRFTADQSEARLAGVLRRQQLAKLEPYHENPHCSFCSVKPVCPVWVDPAHAAVTIMEQPLEELFAEGLEKLKENPTKLGLFLSAWAKAEELVKLAELKPRALAYIKEGKPVEGWRLIKRTPNEWFSNDNVQAILEAIPADQPELLVKLVNTALLNMNPAKVREILGEAMPDIMPISGPPIEYIKRTMPKK